MAANADVAALAGVTALEPATASVLIVDDDPVQRLALRAALAPLGHPTVEVESGAEALRQVKCQRFAVILMDVRMPGMDGYEAAALIRAQLSGDPTPIIFITAAPRDETEALSGYRLGAVDFVFAPIVPEELRAKVSVFAELFITSQRLKRAGRHFELSSDLTCTVGFDGYVRQLNDAWELALGWSEAELRSRPFVELIHPDDRELSTREASKLAAGATTASFLSRHLTKDGGWRWLEWNAVAAPDDHLFFGSARDVSERIDADEAVTRLASIVESFDDAVIGIAPDGTVVSWNAAAEQVLGHSPEEAVGRPIGALMLAPPERGEEVARNLARIKSGGRVQRVETVRIHKHGHPIDVALTISPTWDSSGELSGASATIRDISDQKRTRRYLDAQHEATRVLAEAATVAEALPRLLQVIGERMEWPVCAVWMPASEAPESGLLCAAFWHEPSLDLDLGRFETLTRGLTLSRDEGLPGRVWSSRCPRWITDVSAEPQSARAADALAHGLHACVLLPIISGENAVAMIELRSLEARPLDPALLDMFDRLSGQVGLFLERKRGEAALEVSERQNRQIIESAHDAFVSMDEAGRVTGWNSRAQATFGWSAGEAIGQLLAELIIPPALREAHRVGMARFLATGEGQLLDTPLELTGLHRDGHEFPLELTISPLATPAGYSFNAFLRDITERKRHHDELATARDDALEASKLKSAFVANVSHEIRTPMNGVIGMTGLLLDTRLDDEQREYAETVCASGEALLEVIDDILDFSKIEADRLELDPADFDIRAAIEKACGLLAAGASKKGLELVVAIDPGLPLQAHGDAARIRQVVLNMLSNAIKFTASGEVVVRADLVRWEDRAAVVRVEISDTGIGVDAAELEGLFEPFAQADDSSTRAYGGTGLGLAISKKLVGLMGGRLGADSEPGRGSRFWFELSLPAASSSESNPPGRELAGLRALVVDDNATNRLVLSKQLGSFGVICDEADSAFQAILMLEEAHVAERAYALALLDLNMPGVDGRELAGAIRARPALRDMRLMLLASSVGRPDGEQGGAIDGYLTKPVRESRLFEEVKAVMTGADAVAALSARRRVAIDGAQRGLDAPLVLVVEDTPVNQTVVVRMLEKSGFDADVAENGRAALDAVSKRSYAVVLMDCQMPVLDGYDATREIRRREQGGPRTPIIAMTANSMRGDRERCLAAGMDDYLSKPLRAPTLIDALNRWVTVSGSGAAPGAHAQGAAAPGAKRTMLDQAVIADLQDLDGEVLSELVGLYFDGAAEQLVELKAAIERGEAPEVGKAAHKLKGSSATVGAARVSSVGRALETQARAGDLNDAEGLLRELEDAIEESRVAFDEMLA